MTMKLALIPAAVAAIALTFTPAMAKSKRHHQGNTEYDQTYGNGYQGAPDGWNGGWNSRNVSGSDPSFGNRAGINAARRSGRCVEDLGYGRYEYCGW